MHAFRVSNSNMFLLSYQECTDQNEKLALVGPFGVVGWRGDQGSTLNWVACDCNDLSGLSGVIFNIRSVVQIYNILCWGDSVVFKCIV